MSKKKESKARRQAAAALHELVGAPPLEAFDGLPEGAILIQGAEGVKQGPLVGGPMRKVVRSGGRRARPAPAVPEREAAQIGEDGLPVGGGRVARRTPPLGGGTAPLRFLRAAVRDARAEAADLADRLERDWAEAADAVAAAVKLTDEVLELTEKNEHLHAALAAEGLDVDELKRMRREAEQMLKAWRDAKEEG